MIKWKHYEEVQYKHTKGTIWEYENIQQFKSMQLCLKSFNNWLVVLLPSQANQSEAMLKSYCYQTASAIANSIRPTLGRPKGSHSCQLYYRFVILTKLYCLSGSSVMIISIACYRFPRGLIYGTIHISCIWYVSLSLDNVNMTMFW